MNGLLIRLGLHLGLVLVDDWLLVDWLVLLPWLILLSLVRKRLLLLLLDLTTHLLIWLSYLVLCITLLVRNLDFKPLNLEWDDWSLNSAVKGREV